MAQGTSGPSMRVLERAPASSQYGGRFSGPVELAMLEEAATESRPDVARVSFGSGAVTNWHAHPGGQLLLLLEGAGRIGNEHETYVDLVPGTFVSSDPDDRHWHGAAKGSSCVWLTITWGTTRWEDANPDDDAST
jgi:quercetin dioxygenase-like cupin family protein